MLMGRSHCASCISLADTDPRAYSDSLQIHEFLIPVFRFSFSCKQSAPDSPHDSDICDSLLYHALFLLVLVVAQVHTVMLLQHVLTLRTSRIANTFEHRQSEVHTT